ncbi:hypothetical protein TcCL_NonESM12174 [Trypanosoma cruzi]|nr:hypothetical protein TcCL_Unassigned03301 [Trypanosoma cruzi]RNC38569.1 hypothetical protein TcCL_NonESM12174 [Trypanosoma cruzi]
MHPRTGPKMARRHHPTTSVRKREARQHPQFPNTFPRVGDGGSTPARHWAMWDGRVSLAPWLRPSCLRLQNNFPVQIKRIRVSLNSTSPLRSREFGMKAPLESYLKAGALTTAGAEGTLTLKLPLTFWFRGCARRGYIRSLPSSSWAWAGLYRGPSGR